MRVNPSYKKVGFKMKWLKADYRNELYTRITKNKALRLIKSGQIVYIWTYDNMEYVEERVKLGEVKDYINSDIEQIECLTIEYKGRVKFYIKVEKGEQ